MAQGKAVLAALQGGPVGPAAAAIAADARLGRPTAAAIRTRLAREPHATALAAALRDDPAGGVIADAAVAAYPRLAGPKCEQLRGLSARGEHDAVRAAAATLLRAVGSPALAFTLWQTLRAAGDADQAERARRALFERADAGRPGSHWRVRYHEAAGDIDAAIAELIEREQAATDPAERAAALKEAAERALRRDRYGRHAPVIARAIKAGLAPEPAWRTAAWATIAAGRTAPFADPPTAAIEWLVHAHLPRVPRYAPANRLLMIGNSLGAGGMERILANSFRAVKASGRFNGIHLALMRFDPAGDSAFHLPDAAPASGEISVMDSDATPAPALAGLPTSWLKRAQAVFERVSLSQPRIVHAWNDLTGLIGAHAALAAGAPRVIVHIHHLRAARTADRPAVGHYPACYRLLLERPELELLFCSDAAARDYADWWGVPFSPRFRTLRNGLFLEPAAFPRDISGSRRALGLADDGPIIGTAFRFDPVKQPLVWVEAALAILARRPDARFVMLGDGPLRAEAEARIAAAGAGDRFTLPGQVRDVQRWLAAFDLFMMTSAVEGLGNGAVEAQFAGVPLVAFDVGGIGETILPGETGRLVPPGDGATLADAAEGLLADPDALAAVGPKAAAFAAERFGMERYLGELLEVYG